MNLLSHILINFLFFNVKFCCFSIFYLMCISVTFGTKYDKCDLTVDSAICINNTEKIILPDAKRFGRVLYMKFDEIFPVDSSGYGNHGIGQISGHSGFGGIGSSAYFRGNFIHISSSNSFNGVDFTYMFYIYMLSDEKSVQNSLKYNQYCTVIHKGYKTDLANEASPEIAINPSVTIYTQLINLIDWEVKTVTRPNPLPLYIGGAPFTTNCDFPFLLDELSIFSHAVGTDEIQAEASFSLGGIESSYITIGCTNCRYYTFTLFILISKEEAMSSCPDALYWYPVTVLATLT
uniref:Uncharacterized protein n=1 Tax=Theileria parva TaxID=5875 RepID=Q4N320_THEPA|eukprot:XP_763802.1 hypothetical protein [Theileria parva strain Muguga]